RIDPPCLHDALPIWLMRKEKALLGVVAGRTVGVASSGTIGGTVDAMCTGRASGIRCHEVENFREQFFRSRRWCFFLHAKTTVVDLIELVNRRNDDEVDDTRDNQEVNDSSDDYAEVNESIFIFRDLETQSCHVGGAKRGNDWLNEGISQCGNDGGKCATDDDTNCQIDNIAAHDEIFKALEHDFSFSDSDENVLD